MSKHCSVAEAIEQLEHDPLRNIVLLKHLQTYPEQVEIYSTGGPRGAAMLILLDASVSPYDRQCYPGAAAVAFISSDHPELTAALMPYVPRSVGLVFKLSQNTDLAPIEAHFPVEQRTAFVSFTASTTYEAAASVSTTLTPSDAAFRLFHEQGHDQAWLQSLLHSGKAFACVLERGSDVLSACFAFEIYRSIWEIGGVATALLHRKAGLASQVVRTALAELARRDLVPRYQVEVHNEASIALAKSLGLKPLLTLTHYAHQC